MGLLKAIPLGIPGHRASLPDSSDSATAPPGGPTAPRRGVGTAYPLVACEEPRHRRCMTTETDSAMRASLPMTRPARIAAARRKKAAQTREWRAMRNAIGWPEARKVDAAISEAVSFCTRPEFGLHDGEGVCISLPRIFRVAVLVLMRDGADREMSQAAVRERLHPPARFETGAVPSIQMRDEGYTPPPRRKDLTWDEKDIAVMKAAATPYDGVTGVNSP